MSLETIVQQFREKGLARPATLLQSQSKCGYMVALLQPSWRSRVTMMLGEELYAALRQHYRSALSPEEILLDDLFGSQRITSFKPRSIDTPPLEVHIESSFNLATLQKAAALTGEAAAIRGKAYQIVYTEVRTLTQNHEDVLYEIYKDTDYVPEEMTPEAELKLKSEYQNKLSLRVDRLERVYLSNAPPVIIVNEMGMIAELVSPFERKNWDWYQQQYGDNLEEKVREKAQDTIAAGKTMLQQKDLSSVFQAWIAHQHQTRHARVLTEAHNDIKYRLAEYDLPDRSTFLDYYNPFSDSYLEVVFYDEESQIIGKTDLPKLQQLYKSSLAERGAFLDNFYNHAVEQFFSLHIGLQQLLNGGPITNPQAANVSVLQNHHKFPNLPYSDAVRQSLSELASTLKSALDELPDISDLATSTKLRKKKDHTYTIRELPKEPLDVTFGNDSGCCIFVPETIEKIQNGVFVPLYLTSPNVRLFGIYRTEEHKEQRLGLVLAFETALKDVGRVLACNSLELSRLGISGGNATVQKLVEHSENWLVQYAQQHGYNGITMGRHSYNTSVNYSFRKDEVVSGSLRFLERNLRFYSDIFRFDPTTHRMLTRPNSCYWLWKEK